MYFRERGASKSTIGLSCSFLFFILVITFGAPDFAAAASHNATALQAIAGITHITGGYNVTTADSNQHGLSSENQWAVISADDEIVITTKGNAAHGVYARGSSGITIGSPAVINTFGDTAHGAYAWGRSGITIGNSAVINTFGGAAHGAYAWGGSDITIGRSAVITTFGDAAHGAYVWGGSDITIGNSAVITTKGGSAHGAYAWGGSDIKIGESTDISTTGEESHGVYARHSASILLHGAAISAAGANSFAVYAASNSRITGSGVFDIRGDMFADGKNGAPNTVIDLTLENGSNFAGSTSYSGKDPRTALNLTLRGADTMWVLTGESNLTNLYMDGATVDLTKVFGLSVTTVNLGESDSDSGTFIMETRIPDQETDQLIITGAAKGNYIIDVLNRGIDASAGTEITDLVQVNPGQSATFMLKHKVESGGWQYDLHAPEDADLSLYSDGCASTGGSGAINSFAGSYLMAYAETNTLMQRMGDLRDSEYLSGLWFRVHGGKFESNSKSYVRGFDMKYGGVQIGYDRKLENKWDGDIYAGVMFGYSKGDLDYSSEGSGNVDSKALGVYGVYVRPDGFYIDTVLKYQWMTNDFDVIDTAGALVRGSDVNTGGIGASIEAGKRFHVARGKESGQGLYVEPQVQFRYQRQDGGYFNATNGLNVGVDSFTSLLGRVGILVGYETEKSNFYGKVSKVKEFDGDLTIHANGVPVAESFGGSWWVYGIGFTSRVNDRNSLYLDIERTSGGSFSQPWRINAGWRMEF